MAITGLDRYSSGLHKAQGRRRDAVPVVRCPRFSGCHGSGGLVDKIKRLSPAALPQFQRVRA
jgi:hypothetical protein